ncbi:hypothetical protein Dimus_037091, partial [Dionaea muscipula]
MKAHATRVGTLIVLRDSAFCDLRWPLRSCLLLVRVRAAAVLAPPLLVDHACPFAVVLGEKPRSGHSPLCLRVAVHHANKEIATCRTAALHALSLRAASGSRAAIRVNAPLPPSHDVGDRL